MQVVTGALDKAAQDFAKFFEKTFSQDVEWTIAGHGPVARTYHGVKDLFDNAETALLQRFSGPLAITTQGVWADGDESLPGSTAPAAHSAGNRIKTAMWERLVCTS